MEREQRESLLNDPRVHFMSLAEADGYARTEQEVIIEGLKESSHFSEEFFYSALNIKGVDRLLQTGTYRVPEDPDYDLIFCCHIKQRGEELVIGSHYDDHDLVHYLTHNNILEKDAAFAIYKVNALQKEVAPDAYEFTNPEKKQEALVAVYIIENYFEY